MNDIELYECLKKLSDSGFNNYTIGEVMVVMEEDNPTLPKTYAEIDYGDRILDDPEAIEGARWDDMNYQHYMER